MGNLDSQCNTSNLHVFLAPVKLAGIAGRKHERNECFLDRRPRLCRLPLLHEALHAVVGTPVALGLQAFKESLSGASLRLREMAFGDQPTFQYGLEIAQFRCRLVRTKIDRFAFGLQVLAHRRTG